MSANVLFPALDTDGWVDTPTKVADYLISQFFLSDYSQTANFVGGVASFVKILQQFQGDISGICNETQMTLSKYFSKYFNSVEVEVTGLDKPNSINVTNLTLWLVFTDSEGVQYNLNRIITYSGLKIIDIVATINNG